jgi:hypothetical protein
MLPAIGKGMSRFCKKGFSIKLVDFPVNADCQALLES